MPKKLVTEIFIEKAKKVHGDKYDYSKVNYTGGHNKVTIICPIHGEFEQTPANHLQGKGCYKCRNNYIKKIKIHSVDQFIEKARKVHGDRYDYSKVVYVNSNTKVTIICPIHGEFEQTPSDHLQGSGCYKCSIEGKSGTTKEFIEKARKVHGDRYDYSKVVYVNSNTKVTIICPIHGEFEQTPDTHLSYSGCSKCAYKINGLNNTLTTEEFIEKAKKVHGDKYDYSKVVYVNSNTKVIIVCPIHGEFEQVAKLHLEGSGCRDCGFKTIGYKTTDTTEEFIEKARKVHGDRYDYSKVVYVNSNTKVTIICPIHGEFEQVAKLHLEGYGCKVCGNDFGSIKRTLTTEEFIEKAKKVHGDKYDYSKLVYIDRWTKVKIICPIHGEFKQAPYAHLNGSGCRKCGTEITINLKRSNTQKFIERAKAIHGDKYDYSKAVYVNNRVKVIIVCPIHGEFEQAPNNHIEGQGCPICNASKGELAIKDILNECGIKYVQQYIIPNLVCFLRYDFYLPELNTLIEFHGIQHYKYIPFFHRNGEDDFLKQKNRDDIVRSNARQFKYRYLEFNYTQLKYMTKDKFKNLIIEKLNNFKT